MPAKREMANAIRALSMDAVQKAKSGHPGMPMGMADIAEVLFNEYMNHSPVNPKWVNRDRFVLSNGHGSMLLYSLLHLTGYDLSIDDLKNFRQLHSKTAGHPELGITPGVETTTGPLGQGIANAVGMAIAEKNLAAKYNVGEFDIINHFTYAFCGDGCLMEGISHEVCSLAGTLELGKLIVMYDDNGISIDGDVKGWFTDNTKQRFESYGWHVIAGVDGHDAAAVSEAIKNARRETIKPTIICCKTEIGFGSPNKANTAGSHGAPLGDDEIALTRDKLGWHFPPFEIPEEVGKAWNAVDRGRVVESTWKSKFSAYQNAHPALSEKLDAQLNLRLPENWADIIKSEIDQLNADAPVVATRKASQMALNKLIPHVPGMMGGSADLTGSNLTHWSGHKVFSAKNPTGDYIYYGVREFGMGAIMNGMALHGGYIPFGGTFLVFSDYMRNAIRMSALMKQRVIYVLTHDSIGLGEDGPTHQPVEHIASMRLIPGLEVWRPCGPVETFVAWQQGIERHDGPSVLALSRQSVPFEVKDVTAVQNIKRGGYVICEGENPQVNLIATGSEVGLAQTAAVELAKQNIEVNIISMPCVSRFKAQDKAYQQSVLPDNVPAIVIEAGVPDAWYQFRSVEAVIGIDRFGESAPANEIYEYLGISADAIVEKAKTILGETA